MDEHTDLVLDGAPRITAEAKTCAELLEGGRRLVVLTGAGMSQESGLPTFRDALTGLWSTFDPEDLATEAAFRRDPARVFGWYVSRWRQMRDAKPHAGHFAIVRLAERFDRVDVVTQNIDGLHRRAGSEHVSELHGNLAAFRCLDAGHPFEGSLLDGLAGAADGSVQPPRCNVCDSPIRPGVVWFGEPLPEDAVREGWEAVETCDALLIVGTSAVVYPAAELPAIALRRRCAVIEINPDVTPYSARATWSWRARAGTALPRLADCLRQDE